MLRPDDLLRLQQHRSEVVDLNGWYPDDEFPIAPTGAKAKRIFVCPSPAPRRFLIGGHRYLFKEPSGPHVMQIWSEVIAYEVARCCGVPVPPAFLATAPGNGSPGVLIEFFYGYQQRAAARLIDGVERIQARGLPINFGRGSLKDNIEVCRFQRAAGWAFWWAEALAFDTLIGNTDRHSQNWGFLASPNEEHGLDFDMAPIFDNGTSLGFLTRDQDLSKATTSEALRRFVRRGKHHCGWISGDEESAQHVELCRRFVDKFPSARQTMQRVAALTDNQIDGIVSWCREFEYTVPFTRLRALYVASQLKMRRDDLLNVLSDGGRHGTLG